MIFVTTRVMAGRQLGYGGRGHSFKKHQRKWWLQISWFAGEWPACPRVFPRTPGKLLKPGPSLPKQKSSACQRGRLGKPNEAGFVGNPPRRWFCVIREWGPQMQRQGRRLPHVESMRCDHCRKSFGLILNRHFRMRFCSADCLSAYQRRLDDLTMIRIQTLEQPRARPR